MTLQKANFKKIEAKVKNAKIAQKKKEREEIEVEIIKSELSKQDLPKKDLPTFKSINEIKMNTPEQKQTDISKNPSEIKFNPDIETLKEVMNLAAEKIVAEFFNGRMHYSEEELTKDLINLIRSITKQDIVNKIFGHMDCPMLHVPGWDECGDNKPGSLEKCHNGDFVKCQYWTRYLIFRITKVANQVKEKK